jgi:hypothetical protein
MRRPVDATPSKIGGGQDGEIELAIAVKVGCNDSLKLGFSHGTA